MIKRLWCWERLKAGGEGDDRGWDGWMASLTQWTWVWVNSRSWWWAGRPGVLQSTGSQRVGHNLVTQQQQQNTLNNLVLFPTLLRSSYHCLLGWPKSSFRFSVWLEEKPEQTFWLTQYLPVASEMVDLRASTLLSTWVLPSQSACDFPSLFPLVEEERMCTKTLFLFFLLPKHIFWIVSHQKGALEVCLFEDFMLENAFSPYTWSVVRLCIEL